MLAYGGHDPAAHAAYSVHAAYAAYAVNAVNGAYAVYAALGHALGNDRIEYPQSCGVLSVHFRSKLCVLGLCYRGAGSVAQVLPGE